jgi:hypothetical protein
VDEYQRLEAAQRALEGVPGDGRSSTRTATPRRRSSTATASQSGGRGRPRGSGTRSKQALKLVQDNPGITISELADRMGIKQNYLYRVLPGLEQDGLVRKEGRGWHPQAAA